jgi:periplasmic protein TonB
MPNPRDTRQRLVWVVVAVVAAHLALLWAIDPSRLLRPPITDYPSEVLVEVTLATQPSPPAPVAPPPVRLATPTTSTSPTATPKAQPIRLAPPPQPAPMPATVPAADAMAAPPEAAVSVPGPASASTHAPAATAASPPSTAAMNAASQPPRPAPVSPTPARIELPSSQAEYLNNPPPAYPRLSRRLGEQGTVVVRVLIGTNGLAEQAQIHTSSGHERLDQTAVTTVLAWRYVPGKRNGVAEAMWFNVPIQFVLE